MRRLNAKVLARVAAVSHKFATYAGPLASRLNTPIISKWLSQVEYRGVAGLVVLNIGAYMMLNSRFMKRRGTDGLSRVDRHFISSRYNVSCFRFWSVPLSIFNHGDSLFQLGMNCFGLSIVGPAVELMFGTRVLLASFLICGTVGAMGELLVGNHWCRGSSAGVTGLFALSSLSAPMQILSIWGVFDVKAISLAISIFFFEATVALFGSGRSEMAHCAHASGMAAAIPVLYYLRWFSRT